MNVIEDTPERMVIEAPLTHSKGFAGCVIVLLCPLLCLALVPMFTGTLDGIVGGGLVTGVLLWAMVSMVRTLSRPSSLFRVVLEPPIRKVTIQEWVGTRVTVETCLGVAPYESFDVFIEAYECRGTGAPVTKYGTFLGYGDPRQIVELNCTSKAGKANAFAARLREAFGMT